MRKFISFLSQYNIHYHGIIVDTICLLKTYSINTCLILLLFFVKNNTAYSFYEKLHHYNKPIYIHSDSVIIHHSKKQIQFFGNVNIAHNNNILKSNQLTINYHAQTNQPKTAYANGNVHYYSDNNILLSGTHAWIDLNNKNLNLHQGTYHLLKSHIHGTAQTIMQRKNNRYTIIKNGNFSACPINKNYWNILGSEILYDHHYNQMDIWNVFLKIKNTPILYSPYLLLSLNQNNILKSYIPSIKYSNNTYGLKLKFPCPIISLPKYISGSITPCYTSNSGVKLQTKIHYSIKPNSGLIIYDIIRNNNIYNQKSYHYPYNRNWQLYWKHDSIIRKKWSLKTDYTTMYNTKYIENIVSEYTYLNNNHMNQKLLCNYNNNHWNIKIAYLGLAHSKSNLKNNFNYTTSPQLELNFHHNNIKNTPFNIKIFNQLTNFTPINNISPKTIRIHTEPTLHYYIDKYWGNLSAEAKLNITHYRQNHLNDYDHLHHSSFHLEKKINRIIPKFKINTRIILKQETHPKQKYKYFLEPRLQYLYTPYHFQNNIGIYDTSIVYINHKNLFHDTIYHGLDRIAPTNQITSDITMRCLNNQNTLLYYISIGQILFFTQFYDSDINTKTNIYLNPNIKLFSGSGHWNINNSWNIHSEMQYQIKNNRLPFGHIILEHISKNNQIFQVHYRHISSEYFKEHFINTNQSIYYKTIAQLGFLMYHSLSNNWKISCSHHHNIKTNQLINQTINLQYITPCWKIRSIFERKIVNWNINKNNSIYDYKIKLDVKIYNKTLKYTLDPYKMLNIGTLPYQYTTIL